jgi:hypothetical protein
MGVAVDEWTEIVEKRNFHVSRSRLDDINFRTTVGGRGRRTDHATRDEACRWSLSSSLDNPDTWGLAHQSSARLGRASLALAWLPVAAVGHRLTADRVLGIARVIRKFTRNRKQYLNRDSALKLIYMAIHEASKKWTMPIPHWKAALNHFAIMFEKRMP